jgi:hypothetical protein
VRQLPGHAVTRRALTAAATAPPVGFDDPAGQHRTIGSEPLPDDLQTQLVQAGERGQVRAAEGSVRHVEVFRMGSVRTSILGGPRRLSRDRRASPTYTLNCEEPLCGTWWCRGLSVRAVVDVAANRLGGPGTDLRDRARRRRREGPDARARAASPLRRSRREALIGERVPAGCCTCRLARVDPEQHGSEGVHHAWSRRARNRPGIPLEVRDARRSCVTSSPRLAIAIRRTRTPSPRHVRPPVSPLLLVAQAQVRGLA